MKKIIYLPILFLVICLLIVLINKKENNFFLENTYYGESELIDINIKKLNELISEKKIIRCFSLSRYVRCVF